MLIKTRKKLTVTSGTVQRTLLSKDEKELVRLNLHYPEIKGSDRHPLMRNAAPFYGRTVQNLTLLAQKELVPLAEKNKRSEGFRPFGVSMEWENTYEDEKYLSILLTVSVFDGQNPPMPQKLTQVWEKKFGLKCPFSHFFVSEAKGFFCDVLGAENKKLFEKEQFVLRQGGVEFFVRMQDRGSVFAAWEDLKEKKLLKIVG